MGWVRKYTVGWGSWWEALVGIVVVNWRKVAESFGSGPGAISIHGRFEG